MDAVRMVHLRTVPNAFHARVIAARLGADGIVAQLRGPVDGLYPIGDVAVFVDESDLEEARDLLMADEVEAAFEDEADPNASDEHHLHWANWMIAAMLV